MDMPYVMPAQFEIVSQHVCGPKEEIRKALVERFNEPNTEIVFTDERVVMALHRGNKSWTISLQFANGRMCLIAAGTEWPVPQKS